MNYKEKYQKLKEAANDFLTNKIKSETERRDKFVEEFTEITKNDKQ